MTKLTVVTFFTEEYPSGMEKRSIEYLRREKDGLELVLYHEHPRDYPWHFHVRHWTFGRVQSGFVMLATLQGIFSLTAGQTFMIAPFAPHRLTILEHSSLAVLCSKNNNISFSPQSLQYQSIQSVVGFKDQDIRAWLAAPAENPDAVAHPLQQEEGSLFVAARQLLAKRAEKSFSLEELARLSRYSPWHFLRLFKRETGFTPHAFQLVCRLSLVRTLLRTGKAADAALSAGFTDQSHLHKLFKLHHGMTPMQFAKANIILE